VRAILLAILRLGTGQVTALLCAAISVKILAVTVGPAGVGLYSLLRQIQQTLCALASMGGQNAVVQGVASRKGPEQDKFIVSVFLAVVAGTALVSAAVIVFAVPVAELLMGNNEAGVRLMRWIVFPVIAGSLLIYFRGLLNGYMEIGGVVGVNISAAVGSVLLAYPAAMAYKSGHEESLILILAGSLSLGLLFGLYKARTKGCLSALASPAREFNYAAIRQFFTVALPSLIALLIGMGAVLAVRAAVVRWHGLPEAGQFDAAWSISLTFVIVFLTSLQTYLLPTISSYRSDGEWRELLYRALRLSIIIAVPLLTVMVVAKPFIVRLLYSGEFVHALDLLRWTLIGDYLRVVGWILATTLVARADMRVYLANEVLWNAIFVVLAMWLIPGGIAGAGPAYVSAYAIYLGVLVWRIYRKHSMVVPSYAIGQWVGGASIVLLASASTWTDRAIVPVTLAFIPLAAAFSWFALTTSEKRFVRRAPASLMRYLRA
jgi:O-antigen/teichoic acid export membrane protein